MTSVPSPRVAGGVADSSRNRAVTSCGLSGGTGGSTSTVMGSILQPPTRKRAGASCTRTVTAVSAPKRASRAAGEGLATTAAGLRRSRAEGGRPEA